MLNFLISMHFKILSHSNDIEAHFLATTNPSTKAKYLEAAGHYYYQEGDFVKALQYYIDALSIQSTFERYAYRDRPARTGDGMTPEQYQHKLETYKEAITEFTASKGWELWLELADMQKEAHMHNATYAKTQEERDYARYTVLALDKFKAIPFALVRKVETLSLDKAA